MIVGGAILPHPPIILPTFSSRRGREVDRTIEAVSEACRWLGALHPERIVISSPHLEHGFEVPLSFAREAIDPLPPIERVLTDHPSYHYYGELGERLRTAEAGSAVRTVVIASGDLSHRLREDGPYGFHELGAVLDQAIVEAVGRADVDALLAIDPKVVEEGAECGLRSFVFGLASVAPDRATVLSYEGPYGVGYMVATLSRLDG